MQQKNNNFKFFFWHYQVQYNNQENLKTLKV